MMDVNLTQLGKILVEQEKLSPDDLDRALGEHAKTGDALGAILVKMGLASEGDVARALSQQLNVPFVKISTMQIPPDVIQRIPAKVANHYNVVPVSFLDGALRVATVDPLDINTLDSLTQMLHLEIEPAIGIDPIIGRIKSKGATR